ncbi:nuclear pore complex protein Nup107 [Triplophysa rosa]|uniref:Nuclear pore complex protein Nup107 n=1 Tax=Triplophysa rosa TaxID=992332 RepID=A0A9W7T7S6_TRIRA|nr:nuclear pore complex protein Nup107 [Triplophysa rosa]
MTPTSLKVNTRSKGCRGNQGVLSCNSERGHQMTLQQCLCLPMMSFPLLTVLQRTERHQESLRLADIIQ